MVKLQVLIYGSLRKCNLVKNDELIKETVENYVQASKTGFREAGKGPSTIRGSG